MRSVTPLPTATPAAPAESSAEDLLTPDLLSALSDDQVADAITTWGGRVAAGEARLLAYLGEFDARRG